MLSCGFVDVVSGCDVVAQDIWPRGFDGGVCGEVYDGVLAFECGGYGVVVETVGESEVC